MAQLNFLTVLFSLLSIIGYSFASTITVSYTPLSISAASSKLNSAKPAKLLTVNLDESTFNATIKSYTPISPSILDQADYLRIGIFSSGSPPNFRGILASADSLSPDFGKTVVLHIDSEGDVFHLGLDAIPKAVLLDSAAKIQAGENAKSKKKKDIRVAERKAKKQLVAEEKDKEDVFAVRVERKGVGAQPVLNKPVVVGPDGHVQGEVQEKTFLQKYWWAIALFAVMQIVAAGGKE